MGFRGPGRGLGPRPHAHHHDDDLPAPEISNRRMLGWFYRRLAPHWHKVVLALCATVLGTLAGLYVPMILRDIFDDVIVARDTAPLGSLSLQFLGLIVAAAVFEGVRNITTRLLGQRFVYELRGECYRHLMSLGLDYFDRQRTGDAMSRVSNDVGAVEDMVAHGSHEIISNVFHVLGVLGFLFYLNAKLAVVALAPVPVFIVSLWVFAHLVRPVFHKIRTELGEINAQMQERLAGIRVVKAFAREASENEGFDRSNRAYWRATTKAIWLGSMFFPALGLITSCSLVVLTWFGASEAASGAAAASAGTVVAFLAYMQRFYRPLGALGRIQHMLNRSLASLARIFELLDEKPSVQDKPDAIELDEVAGRVDLEGVSFRYATGEVVLRRVSVSAQPGETIAIVGRSGAGKTSLINLVARFYDPTEGRVLVDGHDARDVTQASLRRHIAMVLQETFLFNASARDNIRYARPDATDEDIVQAAKGAYAHDFITGLPKGYDTVIGERGVRLSGGERQRIAIARALLCDPRILILDEATSMVDTEAEQAIQAALAHLSSGRTTFVIAHRLSTVRRADKIVVIDSGEIVEEGRHDTLMDQDGRYKEMVTRQLAMDQDWAGPEGQDWSGYLP